MVKPYYAVKCNPDPQILKLLASLGTNFDCATMGELDLVLNQLDEFCVAPDQIVYAQPQKMDSHIRFADEHRVNLTVVDSEDELYKMARLGSRMSVLIRLTTDDKDSICQFSKKFGCKPANAPLLLEVAKSLGIDVRGVSFHVGSGCGDPQAYVTALRDARNVFDAAEALQMPACSIVDLGGGWPGSDEFSAARGLPTFIELAAAVKSGINEYFSSLKVKFIAEPGRYFVAHAGYLSTKVHGRRGGNATTAA